MADKIRVFIADDEPGMRMILSKIVEREDGFEVCGEADNGPELIRQFEMLHPDVCFLDVEMPGLTGLECAKLIQDMEPRTSLIFATAHDDYMAQAFEVYAFDYLVKPFKLDRVRHTLQRILQVKGESREMDRKQVPQRGQRTQTGRIMLRHKDGVNFVSEKDILLIQRENRATVLYATEGRRFETSDSLGEIEARLDPTHFFRCHKSYIINLDAIDTITPYGRWTYVVHLLGTKQDALITHDKYEELEQMFS
ncbi:MAG: response regulator transcription factor [Clostridia bacterium]|nr:response regulator transcription factor [Clostridia bacterium]